MILFNVKYWSFPLLFSTICAVFLMCLVAASAQAQTITAIEVSGNERMERQTILSYLGMRVGDDLTDTSIDDGLKQLFATGFFADVRIFEQGGTVTVEVLENPIVNQVAFEGNNRIDDAELSKELQLRPRTVFTRARVQSDIARIQEVYRRTGRFSAKVEPKLIQLDQNRVDVVFEVEEGDKTTIRRVNFVNNSYFSDNELKAAIQSKESRWYRFLSSDDTYDPDRLEFDKELLRRHYLSNGFVDFSVTSAVAELGLNQEDFFLTFTVFEGQRFRFGTTSFENRIPNLSVDGFEKLLNFKEGNWYNNNLVEDTIKDINSAIDEQQISFVNVSPRLDIDRNNNIVNIAFVLTEGRRVFVERIDVTGNVRTLDRVIRRQFEFSEGDPFSREKLSKSEQNIRELDYFQDVNVKATPGDMPDRTNIEVNVSEKSTGELTIGAGFSSLDGPLADFRVRERNFLGRGQELSFGTTISGRRSEFDVSFAEPYFLERDLRAGIDVFHVTTDFQDESSYDQRRTGFSPSLTYPLSRNLRHNVRYRLLQNEITNVNATASRFIRDQAGERVTSAFGHTLTYDTRNSRMKPTEGHIVFLSNEIAGAGGDAKFFSTEVGGTAFHQFSKGWVFSVDGKVGHIAAFSGDEVAINDRYFLGGSTTLRGFDESGVGPRDINTKDSLGGRQYWKSTVELAFPIGVPEEYDISGHVFSDVGSVWNTPVTGVEVRDESSPRVAVGFGLSWGSPLGPIRVDFAKPVVKKDYDDERVFSFSFGTRF